MLEVHENPVTTIDRTKARLVAFASPIGWIGLLREGNCLLRIKIGLKNRQVLPVNGGFNPGGSV